MSSRGNSHPSGEGRGSGRLLALDKRFARPRLSVCRNVAGKCLDVDGFGIERSAGPFLHLGVVLVRRVGDGVQELGATP